jgi:hypothetical protein
VISTAKSTTEHRRDEQRENYGMADWDRSVLWRNWTGAALVGRRRRRVLVDGERRGEATPWLDSAGRARARRRCRLGWARAHLELGFAEQIDPAWIAGWALST